VNIQFLVFFNLKLLTLNLYNYVHLSFIYRLFPGVERLLRLSLDIPLKNLRGQRYSFVLEIPNFVKKK
jgi:hypothetical protein